MRARLLFLMLLPVLVSCSRKSLVVSTSRPSSRDVEVEEIDFDYLHGKAAINLTYENNQMDLKSNIRIRRDSVIWMTFSMFGVQGGKALINKDSITVVNTVKKEYYVLSFPDLSKRVGFEVNFPMIQAAMLGNLLHPKSDSDEVSDDGANDFIQQQLDNLMVHNTVNRTDRKLKRVVLSQKANRNKLRLVYSNFQPLGGKSFPYQGSINVSYYPGESDAERTTSISIEYSKAEVGDRELKFPFNIPRKYERR